MKLQNWQDLNIAAPVHYDTLNEIMLTACRLIGEVERARVAMLLAKNETDDWKLYGTLANVESRIDAARHCVNLLAIELKATVNTDTGIDAAYVEAKAKLDAELTDATFPAAPASGPVPSFDDGVDGITLSPDDMERATRPGNFGVPQR